MPSQVYLIKDIDFNSSYESVVDFDDIELQHSYFSNKRLLGYDSNSTWVRPERNTMRVNIPFMVCQEHSYIEYQNTDIEGRTKTFYAFIEEVLYTDVKTTTLVLKTDIWQTYMFDYEIKDAFIEREHQDRWRPEDDLPIFNTINEGLDFGDTYIINKEKTRTILDEKDKQFGGTDENYINWYLIITLEPLYETEGGLGMHYELSGAGTRTGYYVYLLPYVKKDGYNLRVNIQDDLRQFLSSSVLSDLISGTYSSKVYSITKLPYRPFDYTITEWEQNEAGINFSTITHDAQGVYTVWLDEGMSTPIYNVRRVFTGLEPLKISDFNLNTTYLKDVVKPSSYLDIPLIEYEPKIYSEPYRKIVIGTNNIDTIDVDYKYLTEDSSIELLYGFDMTPKQRIFIKGYKGDDLGENNFMEVTGLDEVAIMTDQYLNYLANQKASATTNMALNKTLVTVGVGLTALIVGGVLTGPAMIPLAFVGGGTALQSGSKIIQQIGQEQSLREAPNQVKNVGTQLMFNAVNYDSKLRLYVKDIEETQRKKIYDFLYRYGYKANRMGIPNLRSRVWFNHIKTTNINIIGKLPNRIKKELQDIYNAGTTIWHYRRHTTGYFGMYKYDRENIEMVLTPFT